MLGPVFDDVETDLVSRPSCRSRVCSVIEHLREAKNSLADEHDMQILLCEIEKMLVLKNDTSYCLNEQGWKALIDYESSLFNNREALRRIKSDADSMRRRSTR